MAAEDWLPFGGYSGDEYDTAECKRCGKSGLTWYHNGDRWVLLETSGKVHKCDEKRLHRQAADDFEVLP